MRRTRTLGGVLLNLTLDLAIDLDLDLRGLRADLPVDLDLAVELEYADLGLEDRRLFDLYARESRTS